MNRLRTLPVGVALAALLLASRPGTTEAYMTVSGTSGGYLYTFDALAEGTRHTNGG